MPHLASTVPVVGTQTRAGLQDGCVGEQCPASLGFAWSSCAGEKVQERLLKQFPQRNL